MGLRWMLHGPNTENTTLVREHTVGVYFSLPERERRLHVRALCNSNYKWTDIA